VYEYIRGEMAGISGSAVVIEAAGVGWLLAASPTTIAAMPPKGEEARVYVHLVHREDVQELYGFASLAERALFRRLMTVSGIGPKQALRILGGLAPQALLAALMNDDVRTLSGVPGLGKKTAEKLVFELKGKLDDLQLEYGSGETQSGHAGAEPAPSVDAVAALAALGFSPVAARSAVIEAMREAAPDEAVPDLIKRALRHV